MQPSKEALLEGTVWRASRDRIEARFVGRCAATLAEMIGALDEAPTETSWLRQVHSDRILDARPGCSGEGDALLTRRSGLAVAIATADCVPVVLAGPRAVAVVHAGWRGIAAGIVPAAVMRLAEHGAVEAAWIGPAIGPCCYEVGEDVADRVEAAAGPAARVAGRSGGNRISTSSQRSKGSSAPLESPRSRAPVCVRGVDRTGTASGVTGPAPDATGRSPGSGASRP